MRARDALRHYNFSLAEELQKALSIGCLKELDVYDLIERKNQGDSSLVDTNYIISQSSSAEG